MKTSSTTIRSLAGKFAILLPATLLSLTAFFRPVSVLAQYDPVRPFQGQIGKTIETTRQSWTERVRAPKGAPNVVWILIDDVGFGAASTFGGLIETPNFDLLAKGGIRYTNFHTTGICSPTRAALLTGRNSHSVAMGHHAELGIGTPGYSGDIPFEAGTAAEIFKENGYNTFALGKWHSTHPKDVTAAGPYNRWPTGRGFEHFFGFIGGLTDQWHPQLIEENNQLDIEPNTRHLNELLADKAISYIANQQSADPDKPFFLYFAPGATHAPHHVPADWINRYKGKFDQGWDKSREAIFKRQQALGLLPPGTELPTRQTGVRAWESLSPDEKKVSARFMEVYAAYLSYTDYEVGRIISYLKQIGDFDNTLIVLMIGDNGGSKEGTYSGTTGFAEKSQGEEIGFQLSQYDKIGTEYSSPNYPLGWSQACNTPFRYWKSDANSEGATHNPMIIHYPNGIKDAGTIRTQYAHVIDILPTTVDLAGISVPQKINGYEQRPFQGTSLVYTLTAPQAPTRHRMQYYELHGGRSIYKDGWKAAVYHPRNMFNEQGLKDINFNPAPFDKDKWELYNLNEDWTETKDLSAKEPAKLEELKVLFDSIAVVNNVYPLKSYMAGVPPPEIKAKRTIFEGTTTKTRIEIGKGPVAITATIDLVNGSGDVLPPQGVVFANGGLLGGTSLYFNKGKLFYTITDGVKETSLEAPGPWLPGLNTIRIRFADSGEVSLTLNDQAPLSRTIAGKRARFLASIAGEGISVGKDLNSPVTKLYSGTFPFNGRVKTVVVEQTPTGSPSGVVVADKRAPVASDNRTPVANAPYSFERFPGNPLIRPELLPGTDGEDINGPSLVRVPDWVKGRLGKYYLYFAHHKGKYIRLAYADDLRGPWKLYKPGSLQLKDCPTCANGLPNTGDSQLHEGAETSDDAVTHVASPDVLIDPMQKRFILYFHCPIEKGKYKGQYSLRAVSADGIHFKADTSILGYSYFRVFNWHGYYYSISRAGLLARSKDGIRDFEEGPNPFSGIQDKTNYLRHAAVRLSGDTLSVFYSRIGDAPERIVRSQILLNDDWTSWKPSPPVDIALPSEEYEGGELPVTVSKPGLYYGKTRELRDPYVYEENGRLFLVYSVAGEHGLAIGELKNQR